MATDSGQLRIGEPDSRLARLDRHRHHVSPRQGLRKAQANIQYFLFQHVTFSINSICHFFGEQPFRTHDESRNVWLLAIPSFGESWHNGHHAFPASAVHGLEPGQFDISALVIRGMEKLRLATEVKRPDSHQIERRRVVAE